jgi:ankyrin repeat protein
MWLTGVTQLFNFVPSPTHTLQYTSQLYTSQLFSTHFLIDQGANVHIKDNNNSNPLHITWPNGCLDVVQLIIIIGTPVDIRIEQGADILDVALMQTFGNASFGARYI